MRVVYVPLAESAATAAAWAWLESVAAVTAEQADAASLDAVLDSRPDVVWIDGPVTLGGDAAFQSIARTRGTPGFLLTGGAVMLPAMVGIEPVAPNSVIDRTWRDEDDELFLFRDFAETPRIRGHAAFRRHRIFDGLGSGAYTWWPRDGDAYRAVTHELPDWPALAGIVAVERAFIHIEHDRATIWEYATPRIVCIGAYLPFESEDTLFRTHLERLATNVLLHLAGMLTARQPDRHWRPPRSTCVQDSRLTLPDVPPAAPRASPLPFHLATLHLKGSGADDPVTLAGRRTLAAGTERVGIEEVWMHPVRVIADLRLPAAARADTTSLGIERHIEIGNALVIERCFVPRDRAAIVFEWQTESIEPVTIRAEWETDLRLMWPYAAGVLGPLHWHGERGRLHVCATESGESVFFAATGSNATIETVARVQPASPRYSQPGPDGGETKNASAPRLRCSLLAEVAAGAPARFIVTARTSPGDDAESMMSVLAADPASLVRARAGALRRNQREHLAIVSPEPLVDNAVEWAKHRLDSFIVDTPEVGRSLVAGYWKSRPGWNDGRPGYAWFFGRDAVWTAFACLACGNFDAARDVIAFLGDRQDLNGKILHECTTSGSVHYDSADATPLWLLLAARYNAWSGDIAFTRTRWQQILRALAFCLSTDRDDDGLIENTRVGHGWIEFGRLGGGRATFYNAGVWTAALREIAITAESIGERDAAARLTAMQRKAEAALVARFYDAERDSWALRIEPDEFTPTATHAVPLLLGTIDPARAQRWLDLVATDEFTADWGVRMLARSDPGYDPASYHGGAVWPLYTGWVSWAEFAAGRTASAVRHWKQVAGLAFEREKGAWEEVLHGEHRRPAGVCPDQAWSAAMAISPLVYGLLGAEPDATRNRLTFRPAIPDEWPFLDVHGLRIGDASISLRFRRDGRRCIFRITQESGAVPVRLVFEPAIAGRAVTALVDGNPAQLAARPHGDRLRVPVQLVLDHERVLELEVPD